MTPYAQCACLLRGLLTRSSKASKCSPKEARPQKRQRLRKRARRQHLPPPRLKLRRRRVLSLQRAEPQIRKRWKPRPKTQRKLRRSSPRVKSKRNDHTTSAAFTAGPPPGCVFYERHRLCSVWLENQVITDRESVTLF